MIAGADRARLAAQHGAEAQRAAVAMHRGGGGAARIALDGAGPRATARRRLGLVRRPRGRGAPERRRRQRRAALLRGGLRRRSTCAPAAGEASMASPARAKTSAVFMSSLAAGWRGSRHRDLLHGLPRLGMRRPEAPVRASGWPSPRRCRDDESAAAVRRLSAESGLNVNSTVWSPAATSTPLNSRLAFSTAPACRRRWPPSRDNRDRAGPARPARSVVTARVTALRL